MFECVCCTRAQTQADSHASLHPTAWVSYCEYVSSAYAEYISDIYIRLYALIIIRSRISVSAVTFCFSKILPESPPAGTRVRYDHGSTECTGGLAAATPPRRRGVARRQ